jgi:hypothetical protein
MTNKNVNLEEIIKSLSDEEKGFVKNLALAEEVYESVVSLLNIPQDDLFFQNIMVGTLKRQTKDHLIFSIWNNLSAEQSLHFKDFLNQSSVVYPYKSHEEALLEFALMYPELMDKIYKSLSEFFKNFIDTFNRINAA